MLVRTELGSGISLLFARKSDHPPSRLALLCLTLQRGTDCPRMGEEVSVVTLKRAWSCLAFILNWSKNYLIYKITFLKSYPWVWSHGPVVKIMYNAGDVSLSPVSEN